MTIAEFLEARISEDEAGARAAIRRGVGKWHVGEFPDGDGEVFDSREVYGDDLHIYDEGGHDENQAEHIARHDPARVLAECAAKRALLGRYKMYYATRHANAGNPTYHSALGELAFTLSTLAAIHSDHPDYRQEWAL